MSRRKPAVLNRRVLINLLSGNGLAGICTYAGRDALVLRGVTVHQPDSEPTPADGEILVDRSSVDFIQLLP